MYLLTVTTCIVIYLSVLPNGYIRRFTRNKNKTADRRSVCLYCTTSCPTKSAECNDKSVTEPRDVPSAYNYKGFGNLRLIKLVNAESLLFSGHSSSRGYQWLLNQFSCSPWATHFGKSTLPFPYL